MPSNPTVVFTKPREVVIEDRPVPKPKAGEMLIRTRRTLISTGTETTILSGEFAKGSAWANYGKFPFLPGYDNVGEVVEVGEGVGREWIGRNVAAWSGHAAFVTCAATRIWAVPPGVPDEQAVFFTISEIVMNGVRRGGVTWGEAAAVYGLGLLGQFAVQFCQLAGARPVFAIDVSDWRLNRLPKRPGIIPVNPQKDDVVARVKGATRERMADVVFEVTGNPKVIPDEFSILRGQGRLVVLSSPRGPTLFDFHDLCNVPSTTIIGAHNSSHPPQATPNTPWSIDRHVEQFLSLTASGELDVACLISERAPYTKAPEMYMRLLTDRSGMLGVVLDWAGASA